MVKVTLRYIQTFRDRHGHQRIYFRRGNKRLALPGPMESPAFFSAYQAAMAGFEAPSEAVPATSGCGGARTMSALIDLYYASPEWKALRESTRPGYRSVLERFRADHGHRDVAKLERSNVRRLLAARSETPHAGNRMLKLLRLLMRIAQDEGWRRDDPTVGVKQLRVQSDGFHSWSEDEIAAFEAYWPIGSKPRLAMALLLFTGQRRGDMVQMGRQHIRAGILTIRQQKTGKLLEIPVLPQLQKVLGVCPADQMTFLLTGQGRPFTANGFGNWFRDCITKAGLPERCSSHGLRKAAARRFAEAGCTTHQIAAFTGHESLKEVERYTRAADRLLLAQQAAVALGRHEKER